MSYDADGWRILVDWWLGRRLCLDVRARRWAVAWAGMVGPVIFHGQVGLVR